MHVYITSWYFLLLPSLRIIMSSAIVNKSTGYSNCEYVWLKRRVTRTRKAHCLKHKRRTTSLLVYLLKAAASGQIASGVSPRRSRLDTRQFIVFYGTFCRYVAAASDASVFRALFLWYFLRRSLPIGQHWRSSQRVRRFGSLRIGRRSPTELRKGRLPFEWSRAPIGLRYWWRLHVRVCAVAVRLAALKLFPYHVTCLGYGQGYVRR